MSTADPSELPDPFGLADLRSATLRAWRASPTRFAEDSSSENDLVTVGYRDRLITELAANAADAAAAAGVPGRLTIWADDGGLHVANTGAPVTVAGAQSLLALRVSAKTSDDAGPGKVGRFGVGFTATAAVADRVEVRSTTGSFAFDRADTARAVRAAGLDPDTVDRAPLLRLAWPIEVGPARDHDTEIVLVPSAGGDTDVLASAALDQAPDLLLELEALAEVRVGDTVVGIRRDRGAGGTSRIGVTTDSPHGVHTRTWLEATRSGTRWLVEIGADGPVIAHLSTLRAPTPTDIELSLPALCITDLALTPDRRHLHPDADIETAAVGYADLVAALVAPWRPLLIPVPARAHNRDDASLIAGVLGELRTHAWLPAVAGTDLAPERAVVLPDLTAGLADVLAPLMGDLAHPDVSERRDLARLRSVGVREIGLADLAERLAGIDRPPTWWHDLYAALSPLVTTAIDAEELGALPVPRSDGRTNIGARGLFVTDRIDRPISWIPTVTPQARHPLLERLGAEALSVEQALADPALAALIDTVDDDEAAELADEVFALLAADPDATVPDALSGLLVPDSDGELRNVDELLLADSPLASVLVDDAPFGTVDPDLEKRVGAEVLRRLGAGWGFLTLVDDLPVAPDHDLPDEEEWWDAQPDAPETLAAVRDLDLVDERRWPRALTLLATDDTTAPLLADRDGYTAWWLRRHAVVDGHRLGWYRAPSDTAVEGVRDPLDHPHADALGAALGGIAVESAHDAETMLANLGDRDRTITPGVAVAVYASVVAAVRAGTVSLADIAVPQRIRAVSGEAVERALVVDRPWLVQVLDAREMVLAGLPVETDAAETLAEILDLPTAGDELDAVVRDPGEAVTAGDVEPVLYAAQWGREPSGGEVRLHDELWIRLRRNGVDDDVRVDLWVDGRGITHLQRRFRS
ncbi:sacsin N-terminal ATP-binding-like domain-containing protein [Gordonia rhizosphera]|uniref:ATP-binding protein n=1 Tax=Gordonia rhizosphera NBRC 16068 TaxID=1108045 RepID=K6VP88_9ACTN|nr:hypothetical protein [Gordonia rhizosphera]GAB88720.1 hypothetical protein GORHZ_037_00280 [Gordonia rhizosphera NBRC 16068]